MSSLDLDPNEFEGVTANIEEAQPGWSLVIKHEGRPVLFQVENKKLSDDANGTVITLESEPLADGQPLRVQGPLGTTVHRIVRKSR